MSRILQWLVGLSALVVAFNLVILCAMAGDLWPHRAGPRGGQDKVQTGSVHLRGATLVGDGPTMRIGLYADQGDELPGSLSGGSKKPGETLINIGFLTPGTPARWMFPKPGMRIQELRALSLSGDLIGRVRGGNIFDDPTQIAPDLTARNRDEAHEVALMLVLIEPADTDDPPARMTLALSRPDGTGRTDLASGLRTRPQVLPSRTDLAFLIETDTGREVLRVDPASFLITDRQPVPLP